MTTPFRLAALLFIPIAFLTLNVADARRGSLLVDPEPISVPAGLSAKDVAKAIKVGIVRRGWIILKDENGQIAAVLNVRRHTAHIAIAYNTKEVRIKYVSSDELNYEEKNGERYIHGNYTKWIQNVQTDIQRELQLLSIK